MRVIEDQTVLPKIKQAWMRKMQITLTSKNNQRRKQHSCVW